jgi:uncharacterized protein (TIGR00369 family)
LNLKRSERCFGCGDKNPAGLQLKVVPGPNYDIASFTPGPEHEGYEGIVHGGIIATLLDEVMSWACVHKGHQAVTAELRVRFQKPVAIGQALRVLGWVVAEKGRLIITKGEVRTELGAILARAIAKYIKV